MRRLPFKVEVVRNQLLGLSRVCDVVHKFGRAPNLGTSMITIWGQNSLLTYLTAAKVLKVSSSDVKDASGGVGATTVRVMGLDADYLDLSEDVTMNGQTAVNTVAEFLRVFRVQVLAAGSELDNAGTIYVGDGTVTSGVPATKYGSIEPGMNQSQMTFYTIPAERSGFVYRPYVSPGVGRGLKAGLFAREVGGVFQLKYNYDSYQSPFADDLAFPLPFPEKTDLEMRGQVDASTTAVSAGIVVLLVDNSGL